MQEQCFEVSRTTNADVQRKLKNKYDTRAAAAVENITKQGSAPLILILIRILNLSLSMILE